MVIYQIGFKDSPSSHPFITRIRGFEGKNRTVKIFAPKRGVGGT